MTCRRGRADVGVPAIIAEAGGCGRLERGRSRRCSCEGVRNALRLARDAARPGRSRRRQEMQFVGAFDWLRCRDAGWWEAAVGVGAEVAGGELLGRVENLYGDVLEELHAPRDGVVLFLTTSAAVSDDGLLLGLGAELSTVV